MQGATAALLTNRDGARGDILLRVGCVRRTELFPYAAHAYAAKPYGLRRTHPDFQP